MNKIPVGAIPKLFRQKNKEKKEVGAWYVNVNAKPINLRTQDYMKARERARQAYYEGKREFEDDRYTDVPALPPMSKPEVKDLPQNGTSAAANDWTVDLGAAASAGTQETPSMPPIIPEVFPPNGVPRETKGTNGNAEFGAEKPAAEDDSTEIDPEMLEELTKQVADGLVELQLMLQEWLAKRYLKVQAGQVPEVSKARSVPAKVWQKWFRTLMPENVPIPPYLAAPLMAAALSIPIQLEGATALKTEPPTTK